MTVQNSKGKISAFQFFSLVFVSRAVVSLTYIQAVTVGDFSTEILISYVFSFLLSVLFSLPAVFCIKKGISIRENKFASLFYTIYCLYICSLTVSRFCNFIVSKMNSHVPVFVILFIVLLSAGYGAYLGIESLSRFGFFCAVSLCLVTVVVIGLNIKNFDILNLYPVYANTKSDMVKSTLIFCSNTTQSVLLLLLSDKVNINPVKPYFFGIGLSYFIMFLFLLFCCGVLGSNANLQSFPIYSLFCLASVGDMSRLDILHTSFWTFAVYLKCAVLLYCCTDNYAKNRKPKAVFFFTALSLIIAVVINYFVGTHMVYVSKIAGFVSFVVFVMVIPLIFVIKRKMIKE